MEKADSFEKMLRVFSPFPLNNENFSFYVDTSNIRNVIDARKQIIAGLSYNMNPYTKILFMGHRGCGKTTEMLYISKELKQDYEIIMFSMAEEAELEGIKYIDVLFVIMKQIVEYVKNSQLIRVDEKILDDMLNYWNSEEIIEKSNYDKAEAEVNAGAKLSFLQKIAFQVSGVLKTGSESKKMIRTKIETKAGYLLMLMNNMIEDINCKLKHNNKQLLIIIEDLDKIGIHEARNIFIDHRKTLTSLNLKMVCSFPIYMAYAKEYSMIQDDFDDCILYSMIKVNNADKSRNEEGIDVLKEIVYRRMTSDLIENEALDYLVLKSGGVLRDLFSMLRFTALLKLGDNVGEKIDIDDAKLAVAQLKSQYERPIASEQQFNSLIKIYNDPYPENTDSTLQDLLFGLAIIEYNGKRWCGVHPVLVEFLQEKGKI